MHFCSRPGPTPLRGFCWPANRRCASFLPPGLYPGGSQRMRRELPVDLGANFMHLMLLGAAFAAIASAQAVRQGFTGGGTLLKEDDVASLAQPLGFSVNFFGTTYTSAYITDNGYITFDGQKTDFTPEG